MKNNPIIVHQNASSEAKTAPENKLKVLKSDNYVKTAGAKISKFRHIQAKEYQVINDLSPELAESFGAMNTHFTMLVWGQSSSGKSNLVTQLMSHLAGHGRILHLSLEEGIGITLQNKLRKNLSHLPNSLSDNILFSDHQMNFDRLKDVLKKRQSPKFVVVDSLQYFGVNYHQYKELKSSFPQKSFIFISHANGKLPDGKTADKIRYDADIKVFVEGGVAFIKSRFGGGKPWVIWEEGAKQYWGKHFKKMTS